MRSSSVIRATSISPQAMLGEPRQCIAETRKNWPPDKSPFRVRAQFAVETRGYDLDAGALSAAYRPHEQHRQTAHRGRQGYGGPRLHLRRDRMDRTGR